jgi:hypothetical protein
MIQTTPAPPSLLPTVLTSGELAPLGDPAIRAGMNIKPVEWPLRFRSHNFGAYCYDTLECHVIYDDFDHGRHKPMPSSASRGPDYQKTWRGGYLGIRNFPSPARVTWRSKDGTSHQAEIDIGELFKDELVRHHVPREEVADSSDGQYDYDPSILLEVNDRTIRVYMRAFVPTNHLQEPGNARSGSRRDLILVSTHMY